MIEHEHLIYILTDPKNDKIKYVGQTTKKLQDRLNSHISKAKSSPNKTTHKNTWIKSLIKKKLRPNIILIDVASSEDWKDKEKYYIKKYKEQGEYLLNISEGGDSGAMPGGKRKWRSVEEFDSWRNKISIGLKKRKITNEERERMASNCKNTHTGRKRSEETRQKLKNSKLGEKNHRFGLSLSEERKKQNSLFMTNNKLSEETKIKIKLNQPNRKMVVQKTKDDKVIEIFMSVADAKRKTKLSNINKVLKGKMNFCGGYKWEYHHEQFYKP